jgi:hypothetical protein
MENFKEVQESRNPKRKVFRCNQYEIDEMGLSILVNG